MSAKNYLAACVVLAAGAACMGQTPATPPAKDVPAGEVSCVDLSGVANRALADDVDNDGKGGWTDQGPGADMRLLATGRRSFGGVPFFIPPGDKSVVVLKSANRNPGNLPDKVSIPVGAQVRHPFLPARLRMVR